MVDIKHSAYATIATALSTELNSLANNSNSAASSAIDNTSALELVFDVELVTGSLGAAASAGARIDLFVLVSVDGTNYPDTSEVSAQPILSFPMQAQTGAQRVTRALAFENPPALMKFFARNVSGQALNASGNTIKIRARHLTAA